MWCENTFVAQQAAGPEVHRWNIFLRRDMQQGRGCRRLDKREEEPILPSSLGNHAARSVIGPVEGPAVERTKAVATIFLCVCVCEKTQQQLPKAAFIPLFLSPSIRSPSFLSANVIISFPFVASLHGSTATIQQTVYESIPSPPPPSQKINNK